MSLSKIYALRDHILMPTVQGRKLVRLYYAINEHFYASLNSDVFLKALDMADDAGKVVDRLNNENYSGIVFIQNFINEVRELMDSSMENSKSAEYKKDIDLLIQKMSEYKDLNRQQFMAKLNED